MSRPRFLVVLFLFCASSGCTHVQLRRNTVHQALTVGDIHQQQVLNNLAMFVYNPNALPTFSYPNQSSSNVTDTGMFQATPAWARGSPGFLFSAVGSLFSAQRQAAEAFTLNPVNDPRKLELMRCAYQKAIAGCGMAKMSETCPDCVTIQKKFYTGDPDGDITTKANGIVTSECLTDDKCWFHYSCKKCVPKYLDCTPVGYHCGVYVWVTPDGRDQLTKLTLTILDYALNSAPVPLTKTVQYYIDEYGLPTTQSASVGVVSATIQIDEDPASLMNMKPSDEVRLEQVLRERLLQVSLALADAEQTLRQKKQLESGDPDSARFNSLLAEQEALHAKLRYLGEQLRIEGLKHRYTAAGPPPAVPSSILPFQLQQQALAPRSTVP